MVADSTKPVLRDANGRFVAGTRAGPGGAAPETIAWRKKFQECITEDNIREGVEQLMIAVRAGAPWAIKELLDRTIGRPAVMVDLVAEVSAEGQQSPLPSDYLAYLAWRGSQEGEDDEGNADE